jgi:chemosensory pili system protein ChpA (sensor histidine kinase/response regulator)
MEPEQQQRIMGYFIEEAKDHLNTIEQGLLNLQSTIADPDMMNEVYRAAHSIKGGAAMLGLSSIQTTAYRLEDYFKILKDTVGIQLDQTLELLLVQVFHALQRLLEHLQSPSGLTEEVATPIMAEIEPVFGEIAQHLDQLEHQAASQNPVEEVSSQAETASNDHVRSAIFQSEVPEQLREMLQLFRQADTRPDVRDRLQDICFALGGLGDAFGLPAWSHLLEMVRQAIAHPGNDNFQSLASVTLKEIKQAQELVLAGREQEIVPSAQLQDMVPDQPDLSVDEDLVGLFTIDESNTDEFDLSGLDFAETESTDLADLDLNSMFNLPTSNEPSATPDTTDLSLESMFDMPDLGKDSTDVEPPQDDGPEMGMEELNSLADLFEEDMPDLASGWQQEERIDPTAINSIGNPSPDLSDASTTEPTTDFSDLFDDSPSNPDGGKDEDLASLFGDSLLDDIEPSDTNSKAASTPPDFDGVGLLGDQSVDSAQDLDLKDLGFDDLDLNLEDFNDPKSSLELEERLDLKGTGDSLGGLGELFAGLEDADLNFASSANGAVSQQDEPTIDSAADLSGLFDVEFQASEDSLNLGNDLLADLSGDAVVEDTSLDLTDDLTDNLLSEVEQTQHAETSIDLNADLDALSLDLDEVTATENDPLLDDLLDFETELATEGNSISNNNGHADFDFDLESDENAALDALFDEQSADDLSLGDWSIEELSTSNSAQGSVSDDLQLDELMGALGEPKSVEPNDDIDFGLDLDEMPPSASAIDSTELGDLFNESLLEDLEPDSGDENLSKAEADLAGLFGEESLSDLSVNEPQTESLNGTANGSATSDLVELLGVDQAESADNSLIDLELADDSDGLDDLLNVDLAIGENTSLDPEMTFSDDGLNLDDLNDPEKTSEELESSFDGLDDFNLESSDGLDGLNSGGSDLDLGLFNADAQPPSTNSTATHSFDDLDLNFDDLAVPNDATDDLGNLSDLLGDGSLDLPSDGANSKLDDLLGAGIMTASVAGLGAAAIAATQTSNHQDENEPAGEAFGELDELLSDTSPNGAPSDDLDALDALLNEPPATIAATDNFADLESFLSDTPNVASQNETEFGDLEKMLEDADKTMGGSPTVKGRATTPQNRRSTKGFSEQTMRVPVKHLDNLSNLVGELVVNRNSLEQDQERLRQSLDNLLYQVQQLSDVGQRMQDLYERSLLESSLLASRQNDRVPFTTKETNGNGHSTGVEYDPLEMDRFTGFHSLSQEMIELIVRVRESASDIEFIVDETDQVTRMFRQVTTQLQEGLTRSRMVPFAQTADRLPRAVRDIALKCGKQAELVIEGRDTLIDKMILEHLYDPMTHLVNNAITHGIESPDVRRAAGKSPTGRITIRAFHQGNQTVISVSDDGAGVDVDRVRQKAIEKGLIAAAEAKSLSRLDIYDFLFHPGFSTKDQADDFAGRGVGMDVVRTSLNEIRGAISTDSAQGKGTTFTIRLPLTLSISKALCCISDRARIAFPMDGVEDMLDLPKERVQTNAEGQPCIAWRDIVLPLRPLKELLGYNRHLSRGNVYGGGQDDDMVSVVVLRSAGNYLALQVDQVLGEQEIVIKQLEGPVPKPVGVAGATVLGDGRIMPIADVLELIDLSMGRLRRDAGTMWEQAPSQSATDTVTAKTEPMVLIVDDSITVRELLSMTFNKVGYRVEQARDGQEAWEKLRSGLPCDIVFCDIEMPRMDGLELLSRIQKDPNLNQLPIAMLTSRGADRHRQMASSLGASGYFTKPYLEESLLDAAQRMLKGEVLISKNG